MDTRKKQRTSAYNAVDVATNVETPFSLAATAMVQGRVVVKTKRSYLSKIKAMTKFFQRQSIPFVLPLPTQPTLDFFGSLICSDQHKAFSTIRGYKSALSWYYKEQTQIIDPTLNLSLENFLQGYKRKVSDLKQTGQMSVFEGKHHLTFHGYCLIAQKLFTIQSGSQMVFAWPFFILQWNLIARSNTVATTMLEHISWEGDSLIVTTPKHKGDQEGAKCFPRHVYANPLNPFICPVLALALLTFSKPFKHDFHIENEERKNFPLFEGTNIEGRFCEIFRTTVKALNDNEESQLGAKKDVIGTHSARKGAASYCSGMVSGPSTVQVFLRAGWSLGNVQDRYLFSGNGGDQLTGRVACGLPNTNCAFSALPPHFDKEFISRMCKWELILPCYNKLPSTFKQAVPYLLASLVHHEPWLRDNLNKEHVIFSSYLFATGELNKYKPHVLLGIGYCNETKLMATGIPPHLAISNELVNVVKQVNESKKEIINQCEDLPKRLTDTMLNKFNVNGAIPVTMSDMESMVKNLFTQLKDELKGSRNNSEIQTNELTNSTDNYMPKMYHWGGRMHMVPEGWLLPSGNTLKDIWNLWWHGHHNNCIQPYRFLNAHDLINDAQVVVFSKINGIVKNIVKIAIELKLIEEEKQIKGLTREETAVLFDQSFVMLMEKVKPGITTQAGRWMELSIHSIYSKINKWEKMNGKNKNKKRKREEALGTIEAEAVDTSSIVDVNMNIVL
jgi:hypothetical protein